MTLDKCLTWSVQVTFPFGSIDSQGKERRYAHNDTITVVASTVTRAVELVEKQWPNVRVWAVNHVGSRTILLADIPQDSMNLLTNLTDEDKLRMTEGSGAALSRVMVGLHASTGAK